MHYHSFLKIFLIIFFIAFHSYVLAIGENEWQLDRFQRVDSEKEYSSLDMAVLPTLPPLPAENASLSTTAQLYLDHFVFEGNTVFSDEELSQVVHAYQGREITAEELQAAKNQITLHYIDNNYINSGAIIPDQQVKQGVVVLQIIEGHLTHVEVSGNRHLNTSYIKDRLADASPTALNLTTLQTRLQLLKQNQLIKYIRAELGPGLKLGEGILQVDIVEEIPYQLNFRFNNHRASSVGTYRGEIELLHNNFTGLFGQQGLGDSLYVRYGLTQGLKDYTLEYALPINRYDTTLTLRIEQSDSEIVAAPFNQLDIASEANTYAVSLKQPVYRTPSQEFDLSLKMEKRTSATYLLDRPFSFSPGVRDGKSNISVMRFAQDWLDRDRIQVIAVRSSFNLGLNIFDATINQDNSPDSRFFTWLGQFQWVRRLEFLDSQLSFRADLQWARESLLPLEKFSLGGSSTVRGYPENYLVYDSGLVTSLEWKIPTPIKVALPYLSKSPEDGVLHVAPFVDYGHAWNANKQIVDSDDITSIGLGLIWQINERSYGEIYWGKALHRWVDEQQENDLQARGIHFEFNIQIPF